VVWLAPLFTLGAKRYLARRQAGAERDRAHAHVTVIDVPAFLGHVQSFQPLGDYITKTCRSALLERGRYRRQMSAENSTGLRPYKLP
jgi:hypothetical protein